MCFAGAGALVAALGGLASLSAEGAVAAAGAAPAVAAPAVASPVVAAFAGQRAAVTVDPDIAHLGRVEKQPPTTADCEKAFTVACYEPGQLEQAYNLWPLYQQGVSGQGTTIVIVDSFGSPTIRQDLRERVGQVVELPRPGPRRCVAGQRQVALDARVIENNLGWPAEHHLDMAVSARASRQRRHIVLVDHVEAEDELPPMARARMPVISPVLSATWSARSWRGFPRKRYPARLHRGRWWRVRDARPSSTT